LQVPITRYGNQDSRICFHDLLMEDKVLDNSLPKATSD
jgi:hypothetical protein